MRVRRDPIGPGQESVWDYPRPPALVADDRHVLIRIGNLVLADSHRAWRVLETSHPPTWYVPRDDVDAALIRRSRRPGTVCEWKGAATYWDVAAPGAALQAVMWSYEHPVAGFEPLAGALTGYPAQLECFVAGERVRPQQGGFYGGWITDDVAGPFKGAPGTWGW